MSRRLVKVAKELNVGVQTIVEHLQSKGFDIDSKPTANVTDDMYNVLLKDFKASIDTKEKAEQLNIGGRTGRKEVEDSAAKDAAKEKELERKKQHEELLAKKQAEAKKLADEVAAAASRKAQEEAAALKRKKEEEQLRLVEEAKRKKAEEETRKLQGLKVVGKISLEKSEKPAAPKLQPQDAPPMVQEQQVSLPLPPATVEISEKPIEQRPMPQLPAGMVQEEVVVSKKETPASTKEPEPQPTEQPVSLPKQQPDALPVVKEKEAPKQQPEPPVAELPKETLVVVSPAAAVVVVEPLLAKAEDETPKKEQPAAKERPRKEDDQPRREPREPRQVPPSQDKEKGVAPAKKEQQPQQQRERPPRDRQQNPPQQPQNQQNNQDRPQQDRPNRRDRDQQPPRDRQQNPTQQPQNQQNNQDRPPQDRPNRRDRDQQPPRDRQQNPPQDRPAPQKREQQQPLKEQRSTPPPAPLLPQDKQPKQEEPLEVLPLPPVVVVADVTPPQEELVKIEAPKLKGLKIQGSIDLTKFDKKKKAEEPKPQPPADKPRQGSDADANDPNKSRRKRKKIIKPIESGAGTTNNTTNSPTTQVPSDGNAPKIPPTGRDQRPPQPSQNRDHRDNNNPNRTDRNGENRPLPANRDNNNANRGDNRPSPNRGTNNPPSANPSNRPTTDRDRDSRPPREPRQGERTGVNRDNNHPPVAPHPPQSQQQQRPPRPPREPEPPQSQVPKEVSSKEVDDKIKATMARLSGGGKNKRQKIRRENRENRRTAQAESESQESKALQLTEFITVSELASMMNAQVTEVIMTCMNAGIIVSINQRLDAEIIELVAGEFGFEVEFISAEDQLEEEEEIIDDPADLIPRAPIVTVMGHVDHGKTSLLDFIRRSNVVAGEAGGITQHIGAYEVVVNDQRITFLDTPGHEAFTAMRARGAKVTDIAIIIVAADDSIMPQTKEAISHAEAAAVPIVFAINKIDKSEADPMRIKKQLAEMNYLVEEWGGKYQSQDISAKKGLFIEELLEKVLLEAEILELKANPQRPASGVVLEASLEKGRGYAAKLLVQTGTLKIGDSIVAGSHAGRVRAMYNEYGKKVTKAGPAKPVLLLGLSGAPSAGEKFKVMENDQDTRQLASKRAQIEREQQQRAARRISLDEIGRRLALGNFHELKLIIKGDVDGSIEALTGALLKLSIASVQVSIIHRAVGPITESDVLLASASDAIIIGFQVRPSSQARKLAENEGVEIKLYSVIYDAIDEVKAAIEGLLEPTKEEKITGMIEVREVYKISKVGTVAGCYVQEGKVSRTNFIRIIREGIVVFPSKEGAVGEIASLKRFKDDVKDVTFGFEFGMNIKNFSDIQVGDNIEAYEIIEIKQKL